MLLVKKKKKSKKRVYLSVLIYRLICVTGDFPVILIKKNKIKKIQ